MNRFWELLEGVADVAVVTLVTLTTLGFLVAGHI